MPDTWESAGARVFRFGIFELDVRSRELRKNGVRIKLQEQPAEVLFLLLEHAGEVVTREQIQKHLWSGNTFVDFDKAINSAVRKLREALGDTAENPRFVETLAKRGYRFVAPVSREIERGAGPCQLKLRRLLSSYKLAGNGHSRRYSPFPRHLLPYGCWSATSTRLARQIPASRP